ncbi:sulfotransferase family 2 domain-containing protein [Thermoactinomyces sp. DSM 45892]|uniref:sulfotransferase family 2 domain-containing protein n=1 Tax=Thermoactinomyces sp. DSM 45892 TaxID=1882753 RepID=UPI000897A640|nr:sulfotransferase family 2 domain-containing protein [Thermoactinomyces sp. DSM 45892]SDY91745.1 Sulfotransferase family protein [Thermoactinomyces sp. DSM 45892]
MYGPLYHEDLPIILFWSPKAGCTSLNKWFFFQIGLLDEAISYNPWIHHFRIKYMGQENYAIWTKHIREGTKKVYKLVRNPYTRAVSSFVYYLENPSTLKAPNPCSFKDFLLHMKQYREKNMGLDRHLAPQYYPFEQRMNIEYIYLEKFESEIRTIESKYGLLHSPLEDLCRSKHHRNPVEVERSVAVKMFSFSDLKTQMPSYQSFYTEETADLVQQIYKLDFEKYNYSFELPFVMIADA